MSCNMASPETSGAGRQQTLIDFLGERYSYSSIWEVPRIIEEVDGVYKIVEEGVLKENVEASKKGSYYFVDKFDTVLAGRQLLVEPDVALSLQPCSAVISEGGEGIVARCQQGSSILILDNGRWQDETRLVGACSEEHSQSVMGAIVDSFFKDDWDFTNAPVFGVLAF